MLAAAAAAFVSVFIAEFGDKSQLVCLTMACRHRPLAVLAGAMTAMGLVLGLAVGLGSVIAEAVPHTPVAVLSGLFFIAVGLYTYFRGRDEFEECTGRAGYFQTLGMIFLAEFGDKTQLAVFFLAASFNYPLAVFGGAMLAMLVNHALAVYMGSRFISKINPRYVRIASALLFAAVGLIILVYESGLLI